MDLVAAGRATKGGPSYSGGWWGRRSTVAPAWASIDRKGIDL